MGLDAFVDHATFDRGSSRLKNWKKRLKIITWLHPQAKLIAVWRHPFARLVESEERGVQVWSDQWGCWEAAELLRRQHHRDKATDARKVPPGVCPSCLLQEYLRREVREGRMSWVQPIFEFVGDDPEQTKVFCATGIYSGFKGDLTREEHAELRRAGIAQKLGYQQNTMAKCAYVFSVVDDENPQDGTQVAVETSALGDAVKRAIRMSMESFGDEDGNPLLHPYAIKWSFDDSKSYEDKYDAVALPKHEMTQEVQDALEAAPPDVASLIARGNVAALRATMERHCVCEGIPWDEIFGPAERLLEGMQGQSEAAPRAPAPRVAARPAPAPTPEPEPAPVRPAPRTAVRTAAAPLPATRTIAAPAQRAPGTRLPAPARGAPAPTRPTAAPATPGRVPVRPPPASAPAAPQASRRRLAEPAPEAARAPVYPEGTQIVPCEKCGVDMADTDEQCWNCGARYAVDAPQGEAAPAGEPADDWQDQNDAWGMTPGAS